MVAEQVEQKYRCTSWLEAKYVSVPNRGSFASTSALSSVEDLGNGVEGETEGGMEMFLISENVQLKMSIPEARRQESQAQKPIRFLCVRGSMNHGRSSLFVFV
jgi:hypothetical protein